MTAPSIGVVFPPWCQPESLLPAAELADGLGIDELWLWEDCFAESGLAPAAAVLGRTGGLRVGVGLLPAPLRNVALTAMEVATIDRLFPGRFQHVVGHGVQPWMQQVGARVDSPLTLMREYVAALDRLLAGEEVTMEGRYARLSGVRLQYPPASGLRTWAAGVGPKTLALVGELASGTLADVGTSPAGIRELADVLAESQGPGGARHRIGVYAHVLRGPAAEHRYAELYGNLDVLDDEVRALVGDPMRVAAGVTRLASAGAEVVVLRPDDAERDIEAFVRFVGEDILPLLELER